MNLTIYDERISSRKIISSVKGMLWPLSRLKGAILQSMMRQATVLQLKSSPLLAGTFSLPFAEKRWPMYLTQDGTLFRRP